MILKILSYDGFVAGKREVIKGKESKTFRL